MARQIQRSEQKRGDILKMVERYESRIASVLPKHLTPARMIALAQTEIQKTPLLLECDVGSIVGSIVQAAELGLEFGARSHCHLVPFNTKNAGRRCQLILDYRGMSFLAEQHPRVTATPWAYVVRRADDFEHKLGDDPRVHHHPDLLAEPDRSGKDIIAAYAVVPQRDGQKIIEVMPRWEIDKVRDSSKAKNDGPWVSWYERQARKTVLKRALNLIASAGGTDRLAKALAVDTAGELGRMGATAEVVAAEIGGGPLKSVAVGMTSSLQDLSDSLGEQEGEPSSTPASDAPAEEHEGAPSQEEFPDTRKGRLARQCSEGLDLLEEPRRNRVEASNQIDDDGNLLPLMSLKADELAHYFKVISLEIDAQGAE